MSRMWEQTEQSRAMIGRLRLWAAGAVLAIAAAQPSAAQEPGGMVLWDQHIATATNQMLLSDRPCQRNPYENAGHSCVENQLNLSFDRGARILSILDELALLVNDARSVDVDRSLDQRARLRFNARIATLTHDEAEVHLTLGLQF